MKVIGFSLIGCKQMNLHTDISELSRLLSFLQAASTYLTLKAVQYVSRTDFIHAAQRQVSLWRT